MSDSKSFVKRLCEGGINRDRTELLMSLGSIVINFRVINGYWRIVHHHRVGGVTTAAAWVGLGDSFGNLPMETMLSCRVLRMLKIIWDTTSKIKTRGEDAS